MDEMEHRVTVLGEIVKTTGFEAENIYVMFEVLLPSNGWVFEDINEYEMYGVVRDNTVEYNKRKTVTHIASGNYRPSELDGTSKFSSHFCFPFDYQFKAKNAFMYNERPFLAMQINSVDNWNRHRIEGYGFVRFPDRPGFHQLEVSTWRPRASLESEIHSFFLGGSVRIQNIEELIRTKFVSSEGIDDIVNRFGLETEDAGWVTVNINICSQDIHSRKVRREQAGMNKGLEKLETRKLVMKYTLKLEKEREKAKGKAILQDNEDNESEYTRNKRRNEFSDSDDDTINKFGPRG